jgi:hypothetical protein
MIFPGSWTARGARQRSSAADRAWPSPVARSVLAGQRHFLMKTAQGSAGRSPGLGGVDACGEAEDGLRQLVRGLHGGVVADAVE